MRKIILNKTLKSIAIFAAALVGMSAVLALAFQFRVRLANDWQKYVDFQPIDAPTRDSRVVVFAPHCDDETLGCGGMLALAARNKARVRVVVLTNGDGYRIAVGTTYKTMRVTPEKCIDFAYKRQEETLRAMAVLGVPASSVTFLGYPDRGLARLWDTNWGPDNPYLSRATKLARSPYTNSLTPNAVYCGHSVIRDVQTILERERPTDVYMPHPSDDHSDHYATYCFVKAAIQQLKFQDWAPARDIRMHTYLVHRGDWPTPRGNQVRGRLVPPFSLSSNGGGWYSLELPDDIVRAKQQAIKCHNTQTSIDPGFLTSFARQNELFADVPIRKVVRVPQGTISVDGSPEDWAGIPPCALDPVGDHVVANMSKGGDVRAIYLCADPERFYVRVDCVGKMSRRISYTLAFRGIGTQESSDQCSLTVRPPDKCTHPSAVVASKGHVLELSHPRSEFRFSRQIFVHVTTKVARVTLDQTGWQAVQFSRE